MRFSHLFSVCSLALVFTFPILQAQAGQQSYVNKFVNWTISYPDCWDVDSVSTMSSKVGFSNEDCAENHSGIERSVTFRPYIEKRDPDTDNFKQWAKDYRGKPGFKLLKKNGVKMVRSAYSSRPQRMAEGNEHSVTWMYALVCNDLRVDLLLKETKLIKDRTLKSRDIAAIGPSKELSSVLDSFQCIPKEFDFSGLETFVLSE